jgi:hypothetical protein
VVNARRTPDPQAALEVAKSAGGQPIPIDPDLLERIGRNMRDHFAMDHPLATSAWLRRLLLCWYVAHAACPDAAVFKNVWSENN